MYIKLVVLIIIMSISSISAFELKKNKKNFYQAKILASKIEKKAPGTFYCGCKIIWKNKKGIPDLNSCGYKIRKNKVRANRIEWEHVVPASQFGNKRICWKIGGRSQCDKDSGYQTIETDLHNLRPAIGEINGDRSNFLFELIKNKKLVNQYGTCSVKIDFKNKIIEPPEIARGAIARTYFYIRDKYKIKLSNKQSYIMSMWNKKYKVSLWECERNNLISEYQGNYNFYITNQCK